MALYNINAVDNIKEGIKTQLHRKRDREREKKEWDHPPN